VAPTTPCSTSPILTKVDNSYRVDAEWLQNLEARLSEQAEATQATNELITQLFSMMRTRNVDDCVATPTSPLVSLPSLSLPSQPRSALHSPRIKPANPDNFDGDKSKGHAFLTSCELYMSLTGADYPDEQARIHWALSFFRSGCVAMFAECIVRKEMRTHPPSAQRTRQRPRSCASSQTAT
jgi:hypothetical protein